MSRACSLAFLTKTDIITVLFSRYCAHKDTESRKHVSEVFKAGFWTSIERAILCLYNIVQSLVVKV